MLSQNKDLLVKTSVTLSTAIFAKLTYLTTFFTGNMVNVMSTIQDLSAFVALIVGLLTIIKLTKDIFLKKDGKSNTDSD